MLVLQLPVGLAACLSFAVLLFAIQQLTDSCIHVQKRLQTSAVLLLLQGSVVTRYT